MFPDVPLLPSCWPTVRFTADTTPLIGDTSDASASAVRALVSCDWSDASVARSEVSCADDALFDSSVSSVDWSAATCASAWVTALASAAESIDAST